MFDLGALLVVGTHDVVSEADPKHTTTLKSCKKRLLNTPRAGRVVAETFSCLQVLAEWCARLTQCGVDRGVLRKTFPSLRGSVLRDFVEYLRPKGEYTEKNHNKTSGTYVLFGNMWEFISVNGPTELRPSYTRMLRQ